MKRKERKLNEVKVGWCVAWHIETVVHKVVIFTIVIII